MPNKIDKDSLELLRHQLGSISLEDMPEEEMSESERQQYTAAISAVFPRLEKDIKKFLHTQLMFISNEAHTWEHVLFGRGTYNGLALLLDYWKAAHTEYTSKGVKDDFNKNNPIGEQ